MRLRVLKEANKPHPTASVDPRLIKSVNVVYTVIIMWMLVKCFHSHQFHVYLSMFCTVRIITFVSTFECLGTLKLDAAWDLRRSKISPGYIAYARSSRSWSVTSLIVLFVITCTGTYRSQVLITKCVPHNGQCPPQLLLCVPVRTKVRSWLRSVCLTMGSVHHSCYLYRFLWKSMSLNSRRM
jgi:hypothetical protein